MCRSRSRAREISAEISAAFTCVLTPQVRELLSALLWDPTEERFEPSRLPPFLLLAATHYFTCYYSLLLATHYYALPPLRLTTTHYDSPRPYHSLLLILALPHYYSLLLATTRYYSPLLTTTHDYPRLPITTTYHYFAPSRLPTSSSAALRDFYAQAPRGGAYAPDASARWHEMAPLYTYML